MPKIFISYSRSVRGKVETFVNLLEDSDHEVWWDRDIPPIQDWWHVILNRIDWCDVFIFVASEKSVVSPYCLGELRYATRRNRPILPLIMGDHRQFELPNEFLGRAQWLKYEDDQDGQLLLDKINEAFSAIDVDIYSDMDALRPPTPNAGNISLVSQFQQARQLADDMKFDEAWLAFRDIGSQDREKWGKECDEWRARLNLYPELVELMRDRSTIERARLKWEEYIAQYGRKFDPYRIGCKLHNQELWLPILPCTTRSAAVLLMTVVAITVAGLAFASNMFNVDALSSALDRAHAFEGISNHDWEPFAYTFANGVEMVLVPAGCFDMGNDPNAYYYDQEQNTWIEGVAEGGQQCFEEPFWIDRYEVSQGQYTSLGGVKSNSNEYSGNEFPVENINWFEARSYCNARGGSLPTEAQWEYAARGPSDLSYTWGTEFETDRLNFCDDNCEQDWEDSSANDRYATTAPVTEFISGQSWVGAVQMIGNVWEWTSSVYQPYPYLAHDGREAPDNPVDMLRTLRGGAWDLNFFGLRATDRGGEASLFSNSRIGLRCIMPVDYAV